MVRAAKALQALARGDGTQRDVAELMLAINAGGRSETWGIIGSEEIAKARRQANDEASENFDADLMADAEDLARRAEAIGCGRI